MTSILLPRLTARGVVIDTSPESFGLLRSSNDIFDDAAALMARMQEDGYLYLRDVLDREQILAARRYITDRLAAEGYLDPGFPSIDAVARPSADIAFRPDLAQKNAPLHKVLYSGEMIDFFRTFLGEEVRSYDFTWLRATAPGLNASPHCDIVYMGRGTFDVFTAWTPLGDISLDGGALVILEGSHKKRNLLGEYLDRDVDAYCSNGPNAAAIESGELSWEWDGVLDHDAAALQRRFGGRWLGADYKIGDMLVFTMATVHASLDNLSNRIRLSSDSRYQRASEPADERWIGPEPIGHGVAGKRGRIC
jgi:hypothetical protein